MDATTCNGCRRWTPGRSWRIGTCALSIPEGVPWAAYEAACDAYEPDGSVPPLDLTTQSVRPVLLHVVRDPDDSEGGR